MKAITTKYLGATNTKPSRIKASAEGVSARTWTVDFLEEELITACQPSGQQAIHELAARKFAAGLDWSTDLVSGGLPDGSWCHCFLPEVVLATLKLAEALLDTVSCSERFDGLRDGVKKSIKSLKL